MPTPRIEFGLMPPKEAIDFFRQKGYAIGFDHRDVWQQEHQAAFTVAKAMQMDLLREIRAHVDDAIANGTTLADFKANLRPELVKRGWWGRATMTDPADGQAKDVQLGSPRRLKVIYDTNLRTAHSEGQWTRIQAAKATFPFLMYDHTHSAHERPEHASWDGIVLPADDPWMLAHFPVKAWGCKCRVIQMGQRQLDRQGLKVGTAPAERYTDYTNKRTGETSRVPAGVDPEFNYPPGGRRENLVGALAAKLEQLQPDLRPAAVASLSGEPFAAWSQAPAGDWPIGVLRANHVADLALQTDVVRLSAATMAKQATEHPEIAAAEYRYVQDALARGQAVQEGDKAMLFLLEEEGYVTVIKATQTGRAAFMTSFRRLSSDAAKRDREIKRLLAKGKK
ncbi:MAG: phage minor head protein [Rhodocyclaceae bacterium]|nr:phage minor head protein [Rhodocyclaceae bacterium]